MEPILFNNNRNKYIVYTFTGQGGLHNKLFQGNTIYNLEPEFKKQIHSIDNTLVKYFGYSMIEKFKRIKEDDKTSIFEQTLSHSILFMYQISLFKLFQYYGINANLITGISLGEIAASHCSGMIDLDTACFLIYKRSTLIQKSINLHQKLNGVKSNLMSIEMDDIKFESYRLSRFPKVELSCWLTRNILLVGGSENDLSELSDQLKIDGFNSFIHTMATSFHTSSMDCIKNELLSTVHFKSSVPSIPQISTVTSKHFNQDNKFDKNYFFSNIREPITLTQTIESICNRIDNQFKNDDTDIIIIDISPQFGLEHFIKKIIDSTEPWYQNKKNTITQSPIYKDQNELESFKNVIKLINQ